MDVLVEHLRKSATRSDVPSFGVATMSELAEFNSAANLHGELYRVLVADSAQCSEGVSFLAVRQVHLADVPASLGALMQSVGRAIRMHGHCGLSKAEWTVTTTLYAARLPRWLRSPLALWAFRTQKQRINPKDTQSCARKLLRKLLGLGICSLDDLKIRLDAHLQKATSPTDAEQELGAISCADFLEQLGLWDEARDMRRRHVLRERSGEVSLAQGAHQIEAPRQASDVKNLYSVSLSNEVLAIANAEQAEGAPSVNSVQRRAPRDRMLIALQCLHSARSVHAASEMMHFSPKSADEDCLHQLAQSSREIVPALAELHEKAVDRDLLKDVVSETLKDASSEGESSAYEFIMSDSSNDNTHGHCQTAQKRKKPKTGSRQRAPSQGIALLPGWRTERVTRGNSTSREFTDPQGRRYKSAETARSAMDTAKSFENVSKRLSTKFAAKFAGQSAGG